MSPHDENYVWTLEDNFPPIYFVKYHLAVLAGTRFTEAPQLGTFFTSTIGERGLGWTGSFLSRYQNQTVFYYICWLPPPGEWQQQGHWESWSWKGWRSLSREGDSLSSPTFHTNGVLNFCPYAYVTTYFSPPIHPSNYDNAITGFYILKTYIMFWYDIFRWIGQSNHGKCSGWGNLITDDKWWFW